MKTKDKLETDTRKRLLNYSYVYPMTDYFYYIF